MRTYEKVYTNTAPISEKTQSISMAKEEEHRIAAMGLGELKDLACPKALQHKKDWYMTCVSCDGVSNCKPGRRVLEILENDTKPGEVPNAIEKFNIRYSKKDTAMQEDRKAYLDALSHENPVEHYMSERNVSLHAAHERFRRWAIRFPDVPRDKVSKTKNNVDEGKPVGMTKNEYNEYSKNRARDLVEKVFTNPAGVYDYFLNVLKVTNRAKIRNRVLNWAAAYPDLNEKYDIQGWLNATKGIPGKIAGFDEPERIIPQKSVEKKISEPVSDEVSVEDFLTEMSDKSVPDAHLLENNKRDEWKKDLPSEFLKPQKKGDAITADETIPIDESSVKEFVEKDEKRNRIAACTAFSDKRKEILKEIDNISIQMSRLQERFVKLNGDLRKLDDAAEIMGFVIEKN